MIHMKPTYSFVIPCYNEEDNIQSCIWAIEQEMHRFWGIPYEILVVDNNCTDSTVQKALQSGSTNVRIVTETRKGVTWARQAGYAASLGRFIANIDCDSQIPEGWLTYAREAFEDPKVKAVTGPLCFIEAGKVTRFLTKSFYALARITHHLVGHSIQGGNCIIRRDALIKCGGYDTSYEFYGEDTRTAALIQQHFGNGSIKMEPRMWIWSSARRMQQQGYINTTFKYIINYFSTALFNKPVTKNHVDYR